MLHNLVPWIARIMTVGKKRKVKLFSLHLLLHWYICSCTFSEGYCCFSEASQLSLIHSCIVLAAMRNHWPESNTEPHKENMTFGPSQVDFSTVVSKEGVMMVQTPGKNRTSSEAPQNSTLQTETAAAEGRNDSLRRSHFTVSPVGPDRAAALTSQSITSGEFALMVLISCMCLQSWMTRCLPISAFPHPEPRCPAKCPGLGWTRCMPWASPVACYS